MTSEDALVSYTFGAVLAGSAVMAIYLHYYAMKAKAHFNRAEARLKHAKKMIDEASDGIKGMRKKMHSKATLDHVEAKISKAVADLLSALGEEEKVVSRRR